ncbi:MAG: hypothetical protein D6729_12085 [Deltaproteobacteria bacterium]|nr:MAG: hypothetical protein D6729_12085 [Deltaproteobacteria bacterium]
MDRRSRARRYVTRRPEGRPWALVLLFTLAAGCSVVRSAWVRPDYERVDKHETLRLAVVTAPLPAGDPKVGELWSLIARRYANQKRDFIAKKNLAAPQLPEGLCSEGIEGILHLRPKVERHGDGVEASVAATLTRCRDGELVWKAEAAGSWPSEDPVLKQVTEDYVRELGESVRPYVGPTFHLLKAVLDTLPRPELVDDEDVLEKIELGE